jgi:hypothetical protein
MIKTEVSMLWFAIDFVSIENWCEASVGKRALSRDHVDNEFPWYMTSEYDKLICHFANEEDATLFRLRWCNQ